MIIDIMVLIVGLVLILAGANFLTDGASAIAKKWGMSDLVVGLTVVAFGTSAPELAISILSAINGNAGLAIGNVVGSNIFNVLVIIGVTAMVAPIKIEKTVMTKDIPLVVVSAVALLAIGCSDILDATPRTVTRVEGILLLLFFLIFMRHTFSAAMAEESAQGKGEMTDMESASGDTPSAEKIIPMWKAVVWVAGGLAALVYGGDRFVAGASGLASALGVSDAIIGLTIVAAGTSLPELATSVTAALKGKPGIALGNVIGSNIFNIFLVLGCASTIRELPFGSISQIDLLVLTGSCILFWLFGWKFKERTITRWEGVVLAAGYVAYTVWLIANS